ncbi:hypothetical protein BKA62DRAFT_704328 [Auriculariales sp. MPI-PUGE-AT-0066]|nr:hypothetical protein BKA62DRAFT_704328 [Auriculariales sp. MPI-PUGE-AT-0066]
MAVNTVDEILLLIFDAVSGPVCLEWPDSKYDHERARAPFVLASVCRQWRLLAQSTSTLWTYFGLPFESGSHGVHLARLTTLVPLVKSASIDVLFGCDEPNLSSDTMQILGQITSLLSQWRSAQFEMPLEEQSGMFSHKPVHTAPILQQLSITSIDRVLHLPQAPQLVRAYVNCKNIAVPDPLSHFPKVSSWCSCVYYRVSAQRFGTAYAAQLVELCIGEYLWLEETLDMPCLLTLALFDPSFLKFIRAPKLCNLALDVDQLLQENQEENQAHTVPYFSNALVPLAGVSTITFTVPALLQKVREYRQPSYEIHSGFFTRLTDTQQPVWPSLNRIELAPGCGHFEHGELLAFVESRNLLVGKGIEESHTSMIKNVTIGAQEFCNPPTWFFTRLKAVLRPIGQALTPDIV